MTNEEKILFTLAELSERIDQGFAGMDSRFAEMEDRLTKQEQKSRKAAARQQLQEEQIRQLTECVRELAAQEPIWHGRSETAIQKEAAYKKFQELGFRKIPALRALGAAGVIKRDCNNSNTCVVRLSDGVQRVIVVIEGGDTQ